MKPMEWNSNLEVGDPRVDTQHQKLFALYAEVAARSPSEVDRTELLHNLYAYAIFHFAEEEALMATEGYPPALRRAHAGLHAGFLADLEGLKARPIEESLEFFSQWLVGHILREDRKIGEFLANRGTVS